MSSPARVVPRVKHTYASKRSDFKLSSSHSSYSDSPTEDREESSKTPKRKHDAPIPDILSSILPTPPPAKKRKTLLVTTTALSKKQPLTQLHLTVLPTKAVRTCLACSLSYTRGAPDDEALHKKHCLRISRGSEWARDEARSEGKDVLVVQKSILLGGTSNETQELRGRIVTFKADVGGRVGTKLATLLQTINFSLSAPDLPQSVLSQSKAYLCLIPAQNNNHPTTREKIVGCLIAQHIETAMKIVAPHATSKERTTDSLVRVSDPTDSQGGGGGLYCDPTPYPTPLGIPRIFVSAQYRHRGIARALLDATARTFIHGCTLDPSRGQVAFSQPTGAGRALMEKWGRGGVRIFEE